MGLFRKESAMQRKCKCGQELHSPLEDLGCFECGASCCPACAYTPEEVVFCSDCAQDQFAISLQPDIH